MTEPATRASGLLLHPTSLPGGHGLGDLGPEAHRFVDLLAAAGQSLWQVMPLGPPGFGESPYAARSAFAGNPLLISLDLLAEDGLLDQDELVGAPEATAMVDFAAVDRFKGAALRRAVARLLADGAGRAELDRYRDANASWLDDFCLFMALRERHPGAWTDWPAPLVRRVPDALAGARAELDGAVTFHAAVQYLFERQWGALRRAANERGVRIIGDVPIFVAHDSADVWAHQDLFYLDGAGLPTVVAGVPPDYFSATGQRWGNPLYRWEVHRRQGFGWWADRFGATLAAVDIIRIDHFRGFEATWHVPAAETTAKNGAWVPTPGDELFAAVRARVGALPVIAEDLGLITPAVDALRERLGFPGMKVLQFAFGGRPANPYLPHNHEARCTVYTGTHDNDTTAGWYATADDKTRDHVRRYFGVDGQDIAWDLIRAALGSVAETAIIPVQDVLSLGSEARMNLPGRPTGNWGWRLGRGQFREEHAARLRALTALYGRLSDDATGVGEAVGAAAKDEAPAG
ncbi:MAG: 4-alpha-glucanotransferase [Dehalococcoidia bacterium]